MRMIQESDVVSEVPSGRFRRVDWKTLVRRATRKGRIQFHPGPKLRVPCVFLVEDEVACEIHVTR